MATNNFWESLKKELTLELVESEKDHDSEYSQLIEEMSSQAYDALKAFVRECKPVPKGAKSLVVQICDFRLTTDCYFKIRVVGEYPSTFVSKTKVLTLFSIVGHMMHKGETLLCDDWISTPNFFNDSSICDYNTHKVFRIREIFGNSYECTFNIVSE